MWTYEMTVYLEDGGVEIDSCRRMNWHEAFEYFINHLYGRKIISLKIESRK